MNGRWKVAQDKTGTVMHVVPIDDTKLHQLSSTCLCMPTVRSVHGMGYTVVHNAWDGREVSEKYHAAKPPLPKGGNQ